MNWRGRGCGSCRRLAGPRHAARLEESLERLAAEVSHHLRIRYAFRARQLLQAEEARAVVLHRLPVEPPHHVLFLRREILQGLVRVLQEELTVWSLRQSVQKPVEAQATRTALEVEDVFHLEKGS